MCRLEASLLKIEKKYKIQRWDQKCEDYTQFLKQANKQQKIKLLASLKQLVVERCFLLSLVKRYAKGQAVAIRLNRQLKRVGKNMTKALNQYMNLMTLSPQTVSSVPYSVRKEAVEINCIIERCQEEKILVEEEMKSLMSWLLNQHTVLLNTIENSDSNSSQGVGSMLCKEALYIEMELDRNNSMFSPYIGPTIIPITFSQYCYDEVKVSELLNYIAEFENIKEDIETEDESDKGSECDSDMDSESDRDE
ncbi:Hypothetical predicted protein [Mytilus galloprovincialis]|uniref:Uncharacterized protein n=1 Tax=Mytilus galloprovincialis TaxID=29158 RepID=A0A8B6HDG0_MYTGA|nr:Hypothetical predicted protein [Mytilus galloprovincialis]